MDSPLRLISINLFAGPSRPHYVLRQMLFDYFGLEFRLCKSLQIGYQLHPQSQPYLRNSVFNHSHKRHYSYFLKTASIFSSKTIFLYDSLLYQPISSIGSNFLSLRYVLFLKEMPCLLMGLRFFIFFCSALFLDSFNRTT